MKKLLLYAGILGLVIGVATAGQETTEAAEAREEDLEILERNIRLEFKMVPLEEDDKGVFLVTASSWYHTSTRFEAEGVHVEFKVSGHVRVVEEDRWFITYKAHVEFSGENEEAEFHVDSSALLTPGQESEVARMGDKTLVISGSYTDEE
jgi:hypothetical protein